MDEKTLYLHIGLHKTGSSAIQSFLGLNIDLMKKRGVYIPIKSDYIPGRDDICHYIADSFKKESEKEIDLIINGIKDESKDYNKILISSEIFCMNHSTQFNYKKTLEPSFIISKFSSITTSIKIIVYIRRQDNQIMSMLNHLIKEGNKANVKNENIYQYEYYEYLNKWAKIIGKENIIVCPYEKQQFYKGNIYSDFLYKSFGFELTNEFMLPEKDSNPRLDNEVLEYKKSANSMLLESKEKLLLHQIFLNSSIKKNSNCEKPFQEHSLFSPKQRLDIIEKYEKDNKKIALEFMDRKDGQLFCDPLPDISESWEPFKLTLETAIDISLDILEWKFGSESYNKLIQLMVYGTIEEIIDKTIDKKSMLIDKYNKAIPLYKFPKSFTILNKNDISSFKEESDGWHIISTGFDPHFILPKYKNIYNAKSLIVKIVITAPDETILELYYKDDEIKYNNQNRQRYPLYSGLNDFYIEINSETSIAGLRLDPGMISGEYILHEFEVKTVNL